MIHHVYQCLSSTNEPFSIPIGSMYGIYANIGGILMGSMLPYIAAPWILWDRKLLNNTKQRRGYVGPKLISPTSPTSRPGGGGHFGLHSSHAQQRGVWLGWCERATNRIRGLQSMYIHIHIIKGSWEAILPRYGQIEFWVLTWWRVVRDWHLTLKGGVRLRLGLEGWCAIEKGWCAIDTWPWRVVWRVVCDWDLTLKGGARLRLDLEGWCEISHDLDEGWSQIAL